jgi:hypothetical protein
VARDPDPTPTPIRPGASTASGQIDVAEVEAHARRLIVSLVGRIATWLGLSGAGAGVGYLAAHQPEAPVHREQPATGPEPECTPSADLIDAELDTQRDARLAVDACRELADELRRKRQAKDQDP